MVRKQLGFLRSQPARLQRAPEFFRRNRTLALLLAVAAAVAALPCEAANGEDAARCQARVADKVKALAAEAPKDDVPKQTTYFAHYNQRLGRCLYLETVRQQMRSPALKRILPRETQRLWDIDQPDEVAEYDSWQGMPPLTCTVQAAQCASRKEWDKLLRPYLRD